MFTGFLGEELPEAGEKKSIFEDFNLEVFISYVNNLVRGYDLRPLYSHVPTGKETISYRRKITADFGNQQLQTAFFEYATTVEKVVSYEKKSRFSNHTLQKAKWHADALYQFLQGLEKVRAFFDGCSGFSEEMQDFVVYIDTYLKSPDCVEWAEVVREIHSKLDEDCVAFSIQKNKIVLEDLPAERSFPERIKEAFATDSQEKKDSWEEHKLTSFEENVAEQMIHKLKLDKKMKQLLKVEADSLLLKVGYEVQFYLSFYRFLAEMEKKGYAFSMPEPAETIDIRAGYDLALAISEEERKVVANDFYMNDGEKFVVITGANGGGKTTFARMVGQVLYFSQMGLMVPCESAKLPYFDDLLSHFSNEESNETGKGKLMEELIRLEPMMNSEYSNCFVILNELFTTAATMDAGIMGKKVLQHFSEKGCPGIYVTHIQSLAEEADGIVSMVAELEEDHHTRSFRIVRKPAKEGEYEDSLITKYNMTYEQMKKVMGNGDTVL